MSGYVGGSQGKEGNIYHWLQLKTVPYCLKILFQLSRPAEIHMRDTSLVYAACSLTTTTSTTTTTTTTTTTATAYAACSLLER